jgi:hypothetical protein
MMPILCQSARTLALALADGTFEPINIASYEADKPE